MNGLCERVDGMGSAGIAQAFLGLWWMGGSS